MKFVVIFFIKILKCIFKESSKSGWRTFRIRALQLLFGDMEKLRLAVAEHFVDVVYYVVHSLNLFVF